MGKRGPKPKTVYPGESRVHSIRIRSDLYALLAESAKSRGKTFSDEIQSRLRRTFQDDEKTTAAFGHPQTFLIMRIAAMAIERCAATLDIKDNWLEDSTAFDLAQGTIN